MIAGVERSSSRLVVELLWANWLDLIQIAGMVVILLADVYQLCIPGLGWYDCHPSSRRPPVIHSSTW